MENNTIAELKELGIYEHVIRHRAACRAAKNRAGSTDGPSDTKKPENKCSLDGCADDGDVLPPMPGEKICAFSPDNEKLKDNYIYVYPNEISEIKALAGVSPKVAARNGRSLDNDHIQRIIPSDLSDLNALAYRYLVLSEPEMERILADSQYDLKEVKQHILNTVKTLPVLCAGGTLEVKDGEVVEIKNTAVAVFENVIVHGSGSIRPDTNTKIVITGKLEHIS